MASATGRSSSSRSNVAGGARNGPRPKRGEGARGLLNRGNVGRPVNRSGSSYERELKGVLQGEEGALRRYRRYAHTVDELRLLDQLTKNPFLVVRAAGSHGFDLVALRDGLILPVEVKTSAQPVIHFAAASGRAREQFESLRDQTRKANLVLLYAFRWIGSGEDDPWRIFAADEGPPTGFARLLARRTPRVENTPHGNQVLRWDRGRPLLDLLGHAMAILGGLS